MVGGEDLGDAQIGADGHGDAVGQAIPLVRSPAVEIQRGIEQLIG